MKKKVLSRLVVFLLMVVMAGLLPITAFAGNGNSDSVLTQATPGCSYQTHVQNDGWQGFKSNGVMSGTSGRSLRLEGIEIKLDNQGYNLGVSYQTHIQNIGWEANTDRGWKSNGIMSGTEGLSYRLEAIQIKLTGTDASKFDIYYQVHAENFGWLGWAKNGESSGTAGYGYRLEGIRVQIVEKGTEAPGSTKGAFMTTLYEIYLKKAAIYQENNILYTYEDYEEELESGKACDATLALNKINDNFLEELGGLTQINMTIDQLIESTETQTIAYNKFVKDHLGVSDEKYPEIDYDLAQHLIDMVLAYLSGEDVKVKPLYPASENWEQLGGHIRYFIFTNQEFEWASSVPEYYKILSNYMLLKYPVLDRIDAISLSESNDGFDIYKSVFKATILSNGEVYTVYYTDFVNGVDKYKILDVK